MKAGSRTRTPAPRSVATPTSEMKGPTPRESAPTSNARQDSAPRLRIAPYTGTERPANSDVSGTLADTQSTSTWTPTIKSPPYRSGIGIWIRRLAPNAGLPFHGDGLEAGQSVRVSSVRFFGSDSDFFRDGVVRR